MQARDTPLSNEEFRALLERVFAPTPADRGLAVLVDLPDHRFPDRPAWAERRRMAAGWVEVLQGQWDMPVALVLIPNTGRNNGELPARAHLHQGGPLPADAGGLDLLVPFEELYASHTLWLAPTEFSATAPLKLAARAHGLRAATMPGFTQAMIPALRLDYDAIARRVAFLADLLTRATGADLLFAVDGCRMHSLHLDLRHRAAHLSTGLLRNRGEAGNLPSGEAYIVPYEGERPGEPSETKGEMPVQLGHEVVVYRIERNTALSVEGEGRASREEAAHLLEEPAYGNLAELGLGVLGDFGLEPVGEILLDEKLGLHIAFGRSDHFGGQVGTAQFNAPDRAVHIDRVYIGPLQPRIQIREASLTFETGTTQEIMRDGAYILEIPPTT